MATLTPSPRMQFFDSNGDPLAGGKVYTYAAGTVTPLATYTDSGGGTENTNPVILDSRGQAAIWLGTSLYKFVVHNSADVLQPDGGDNIGGSATLNALTGSTGSSLVGFIQQGSGAVATTIQADSRKRLGAWQFGVVGDGATNDTTAWANFVAACVAQNKKGWLPAGTYLMDSFAFTTAHAGLVLDGETYGRTGENPGVPAGAGVFGLAPTLLRLRTASATFISIDGAYDLNISNISLDGNQFADEVLSFPGTTNNTHVRWTGSDFMGATPTTGYTHRYKGTSGGESCTFHQCSFRSEFPATASHAAAHLYMTNSNAFLGSYENCKFSDATYLVSFNQGSANLIDCEFYGAATACIRIETYCQPCVIRNPYTEQGTAVPFISQEGLSGAHSSSPIIIINPHNNSTGSPINLSCNQPVYIYGGKMNSNNINISPSATWGVFPVICDGVQFTTGGFTGTGATTLLYNRGCGTLGGGVWTALPSREPLGMVIQGLTVGLGAAAVTSNTAYGKSALANITTGASNLAAGNLAGSTITTGSGNTVAGAQSMDQGAGMTGDDNTIFGRLCMRAATSAASNTVFGAAAGGGITTGDYNTLIGESAGSTLTTGSSNTFVGKGSIASAVGVDSELVVGAGLTGKGTQTAFIGGTSGAYNAKNVTTWETVSDRRIKRNIMDSFRGLVDIENLQVRQFKYKPDDEMPVPGLGLDPDKWVTGVIAQEIQSVFPDAVTENSTGLLSVSVDPVIWALVKAVQELSAKVRELENK